MGVRGTPLARVSSKSLSSVFGDHVSPHVHHKRTTLINTPFEHVYVTRSQPDLLTFSHSRLPGSSPQVTSRPVAGPPSLLSCGGGEGSDGGRMDLLTLSSQSLCIRRHPQTYDIKHNCTQPHAHLGTRRRDPSHTVCCEPNWKGCLRASF